MTHVENSVFSSKSATFEKVGMSHKINFLMCSMHPRVLYPRYHINHSIYCQGRLRLVEICPKIISKKNLKTEGKRKIVLFLMW